MSPPDLPLGDKRYLVRVNCEYSLEMQGDDPQMAMDKAQRIDVASWIQAWSPIEAEFLGSAGIADEGSDEE